MRAELLKRLVEDRRRNRAVVLATNLESGAQALHHPLEEGSGEGDAVQQAARKALLSDRSQPLDSPEGRVFLQVHNPPRRLLVVGAVHIAQSLSRMAGDAGFSVWVIDPREAFNSAARFPDVERVLAWADEALAGLAPDHRTALVTLTHDPKLDDPALIAALRSPAFFIGALGSRKTHARRVERLRDAGLDEAALARVRGPVGLDIGARDPAEIAVAILAQVIAESRRDLA